MNIFKPFNYNEYLLFMRYDFNVESPRTSVPIVYYNLINNESLFYNNSFF